MCKDFGLDREPLELCAQPYVRRAKKIKTLQSGRDTPSPIPLSIEDLENSGFEPLIFRNFVPVPTPLRREVLESFQEII